MALGWFKVTTTSPLCLLTLNQEKIEYVIVTQFAQTRFEFRRRCACVLIAAKAPFVEAGGGGYSKGEKNELITLNLYHIFTRPLHICKILLTPIKF